MSFFGNINVANIISAYKCNINSLLYLFLAYFYYQA